MYKHALEHVCTWLIGLIEGNIDFAELITMNNNYKDTFLKYFQHTYNYLPKFLELSSENTCSGKIYRIAIKDKQGALITMGSGTSKKSAENDASLAALKYFGQSV